MARFGWALGACLQASLVVLSIAGESKIHEEIYTTLDLVGVSRLLHADGMIGASSECLSIFYFTSESA